MKNQQTAQCGLCSTKLQIWLDNSKLNEEKKEIIEKKLLDYCPICGEISKN